MQINKIHVELPVAGNKFLSALQQARHPRRRRPESALPKRGEKRPRGIHFGGSSLLCYFFARFSHIFLLSLPFADATTRCEIVFLMNQM